MEQGMVKSNNSMLAKLQFFPNYFFQVLDIKKSLYLISKRTLKKSLIYPTMESTLKSKGKNFSRTVDLLKVTHAHEKASLKNYLL